ncbi:MAG TPA: class I SAM-dependent methyltransferase [Acidimicrobiia bacterium]
MRRWLYEAVYRQRFASIDRIFGSTGQIERLAESVVAGREPPARVATLGCGIGRESIALARLGFDVTGVDFSPAAIGRAREAAAEAGVSATFVVDDLTDLRHVHGPFDLITDFGALSDLRRSLRPLYLGNLVSLTRPGTEYFMFCFRWRVSPTAVRALFGDHFVFDRYERDPDSGFPDSLDCYLMHRREV